MSLPRYPAYKPSGVEWLGDVPEHWRVCALKSISTCNDEVLPEGTDAETLIEYVEISGVDEGRGITQTETLTFGAAPSRARRVVRDGDVLISTVRTYLRAIAAVSNPPYNLVASTGFAAIRPRDVDPVFLGYALHCEYFISKVISQSVGISYPAINASDLMRIKAPFPPKEEQTAIADFLGRETTKISALIAEQQRLINLLQEKSQAVISHAVTKGLNPNAPTRPSGLRWLGEVPAHWSRATKLVETALSERNSFVNGPFGSDLLTEELTDQGVPVIYIRDLRASGYRRVSEVFVTAEKAQDICFCNVVAGDILIAKVGDPPGLAVLYPASESDGVVTQDVIRIRPDPKVVNAKYLKYWLNSDVGRIAIDNISVESTRKRIGLGDLKQIRIVLPPREEQARITACIDRELALVDALAVEANTAVDLLQERRSELISAAVTGRIDVRGVVGSVAA